MKTKLDPTAIIELQVTDLAGQAGIDPIVWARFMDRLVQLKQHHLGMYLHSLRVGWYAFGLARLANWPEQHVRLALFGGCGHDIGKSQIANRHLNVKHMTDRKFAKIMPHAELGYELLKDEFMMTAFIAGLHHKVRPNGYGIDLEEAAPDWLGEPLKAEVYKVAKLVCLADFFDAITTRRNDKGLLTEAEYGDPVAINRVTLQYFPDRPDEITWLLDHSQAALVL